jgi:hypothetical protein
MKSFHPIAIAASLVLTVWNGWWSVHGFTVRHNNNHLRQDRSTTTTTTTILHAKRVSFKEDARRGLVSGINQVANAVRVTLGPKVRPIGYF